MCESYPVVYLVKKNIVAGTTMLSPQDIGPKWRDNEKERLQCDLCAAKGPNGAPL